MTEAERVAKRLTKLRRAALNEIAEAGEDGLGWGKCPLRTRRDLIAMGLAERCGVPRSFFEPVRERLTPLGLEVRRLLEDTGIPER